MASFLVRKRFELDKMRLIFAGVHQALEYGSVKPLCWFTADNLSLGTPGVFPMSERKKINILRN